MAEIYATSDVARDIIQNAMYFTNPAKAIAEYVWNALDNGHAGQSSVKCQVTIAGRGKDGYIEILDNASGMSKEELNNFFKMHAENIARKMGRKVRGMYGTGKCAAFGIADSLMVDTVKNGKRNCVRLTRKDLVPGLHKIPVKTLIDNQSTDAPDGTRIRIERLLLQRLRRDSIKRFLEKAIGRSLKTHEVYWGPERLEYNEPHAVKEWRFTVPISLQFLLGDCELHAKAAAAPLEEEHRGISILANDVVHENTLLSSEYNQTAWRLFGEIDVPLLDSDDLVPAYDNTRSLKLNADNERVQKLHVWLDGTLKTIVKELEELDSHRIDKERERALKKESEKIENILNKDFAEIIKQLESKPPLGGSGLGTPALGGGLGPSVGSGEMQVKVRSDDEGTLFEKASDGDYTVIDRGKGEGGGRAEPSEPTLARDSLDPNDPKAKDTSAGKGRKLPRGGFRVEYKNRGPEARRARYDPPPIQQIEINLGYPELAAAGDEKSPLFLALSYEIAIGEYASAVVQMMAERGYVDVEDTAGSALAEWRRIVNRLGLAITPLVKSAIERSS